MRSTQRAHREERAMSNDYEILTPHTVADYIEETESLQGIVDVSTLEVAEVGDGNLNLVFVCRDADGNGICLKQSLPYVRLVGEAWPLTPERVIAEARGLSAAAEFMPHLIPKFYGVDPKRHVLAMENLIGWEIWRGKLNDGYIHTGVAAMLGEYVANLAFHTSAFALDQMEVKEKVAEAINPELCRITEDLVFTEPYIEHDNNSFAKELAPIVDALRADDVLRGEVGMLKYAFMTRAEALIHGDLHTGSVMVEFTDDGEGDARIIDPEFAFYGPVGFDLGAVFGNYLAARARAAAFGRPAEFTQWLAGLAQETWDAFEVEMRRLWATRPDDTWTDAFLGAWLGQVLEDAIGFGGCKATRRIIGLAKVSDIETLPHPEHVQAAAIVLGTARLWIKGRTSMDSIAVADDVFDAVSSAVLADGVQAAVE
jgi:5-methylthioribose kinase